MINSQSDSRAWITWAVLLVAVAGATYALYAIPLAGIEGASAGAPND